VSVTIRTSEPGDRDEILTCVRAAFTAGSRNGDEEVEIVRATWALEPALDLVAIDVDGTIAGHVMGGRGRLDGGEAIGLAPLAVRPDRQRQGIGSRLVIEFLARAESAGWPLVVLLGAPAYYGRFGFEPAGPLGIVYDVVGAADPHFQVRRLARYDPRLRGHFTYCWEL